VHFENVSSDILKLAGILRYGKVCLRGKSITYLKSSYIDIGLYNLTCVEVLSIRSGLKHQPSNFFKVVYRPYVIYYMHTNYYSILTFFWLLIVKVYVAVMKNIGI